MKYFLIFLILIGFGQALAEVKCEELRKKGMELSMITAPTAQDLIQVQKVIDGLLEYRPTENAESILKSQEAGDYLKLNNYCLFLGTLDRLLKIYIRSYEVMELNTKQKDIIKNKSLRLVKNVLDKTQTSQAIIFSQEVIFELADLGRMKDMEEELNSLKSRYETFKKSYKFRQKNLINKIKVEKDRTKVRKSFYSEDLRVGREEMASINLFLPKE